MSYSQKGKRFNYFAFRELLIIGSTTQKHAKPKMFQQSRNYYFVLRSDWFLETWVNATIFHLFQPIFSI